MDDASHAAAHASTLPGYVKNGVAEFVAAQFAAALFAGLYADVEMSKPLWMFLRLDALEDWFGIMVLTRVRCT